MGAPVPDMQAADSVAAEILLSSFKSISAPERRRHATIFNYWLSIRGDRQFAPIRDLDPLEISDAGPCSVLLEMIGGGEDGEIRHLGEAIKAGVEADKISEAPNPSLLSCIANKLPIVAATRQAFAFEDEFSTPDGTIRCWVSLLPFSSTGTWIDFVYGFVSLDPPADAVAEAAETTIEAVEDAPAPEPVQVERVPESGPSQVEQAAKSDADKGEEPLGPEWETARVKSTQAPATPTEGPGFSTNLFDAHAGVGGFYGTPVRLEPHQSSAPFHQADPEEPDRAAEGPLQSKLAKVRAKANEARMAKLRSNIALYEGLSAAYDFALYAEEEPEEYLKLVEAEGLKIQLRSPMAPVVKLAFDGLCDDSLIAQLEAVLAWALKMDLPRGSLADRIQAEGGIAAILNSSARAA